MQRIRLTISAMIFFPMTFRGSANVSLSTNSSVAAMGQAASWEISFLPIRTARLCRLSRVPPQSGQGSATKSSLLLLDRFGCREMTPNPLQVAQAPSGLLNENRLGVNSVIAVPQFTQANF